MGPRVFSRGARQGCRSVFGRARDGLSKNPAAGEKRRGPFHRACSFAMRGRGHRGRLFWLLLELLPKVTRRRRKTSFRRQEDPGTRASACCAVSTLRGQILRCAQNDKGRGRCWSLPRYALLRNTTRDIRNSTPAGAGTRDERKFGVVRIEKHPSPRPLSPKGRGRTAQHTSRESGGAG